MVYEAGETMVLTIILLVVICILNFVDYFQTMQAVRVLGVGVETNPLGRFLIENGLGAIAKFIVVPALLSVMGFITCLDKRHRWAIYVLLVLYICVVANNFNMLFRMGLI